MGKIISVSTVEELRLSMGHPGFSAIVSTLPGAIYGWDDTSTEIDDGALVLSVNGVSIGRWVRLHSVQAEISTFSINMTEDGEYLYKDISADAIFTISESQDTDHIFVKVTNTDTNPHMAVFTGVTFEGAGSEVEIPAGGHIIVEIMQVAGDIIGTSRTYMVTGDYVISGTTIDASIVAASKAPGAYQSISTDTIYTLDNFNGNDRIEILIENTGGTASTVDITGISWPVGANNSIPAGGSAWINLGRIHGINRGSIIIYAA